MLTPGSNGHLSAPQWLNMSDGSVRVPVSELSRRLEKMTDSSADVQPTVMPRKRQLLLLLLLLAELNNTSLRRGLGSSGTDGRGGSWQ